MDLLATFKARFFSSIATNSRGFRRDGGKRKFGFISGYTGCGKTPVLYQGTTFSRAEKAHKLMGFSPCVPPGPENKLIPEQQQWTPE
jgi:hypothetical protein